MFMIAVCGEIELPEDDLSGSWWTEETLCFERNDLIAAIKIAENIAALEEFPLSPHHPFWKEHDFDQLPENTRFFLPKTVCIFDENQELIIGGIMRATVEWLSPLYGEDAVKLAEKSNVILSNAATERDQDNFETARSMRNEAHFMYLRQGSERYKNHPVMNLLF